MDYIYKTKPYDHQHEHFLLSRDREAFASLMEQGTGKTKVGIDTSAWLFMHDRINAFLIVTLNGVQRNWILNEIPAHMPDHIPHRSAYWVSGPNKKERLKMEALFAPKYDGLRILAMNIEALSTKRGEAYARKFLECTRALFVIDESTIIKNPTARCTKAAIRLSRKAPYRRIMTGTVITESPLNAFSQFKFLDPDIMGFSSYTAYRNHFALWEKQQGETKEGKVYFYDKLLTYRNLPELKQKIADHSYRVLKKDCLDLPEKLYERRYVEMTSAQRKMYNDMKKEFKVELLHGNISANIVLTKLLRLQQIIGGFVPFDPETYTPEELQSMLENNSLLPPKPKKIHAIENNPRLNAAMQLLEGTSDKVIIWARFRAEIEALQELINKEYNNPNYACTYYGGIPNDERTEMVCAFQNDVLPHVFIGQQHSAGYGLTLTAANTVVYYSNDFSLEARLQSEDRAHRIGQKKNVTYIDLESPNTIDTKIINALRDKKSVADLITGDPTGEWL